MSFCDYSGTWSRPYVEAGYNVIRVDLKSGQDVRLVPYVDDGVYGILAAPPCTDFAGSGAQYWPAKDADGRTLAALALVDACLRAVAIYRPCFWVLENPVGRLNRWIGPSAYSFNPCDFGGYMASNERSSELAPPQDAYTKKTLLWGRFNAPKRLPVAPVRACSQGSWVQTLGGKSERTKELRSITPVGFARAFFLANQ